MGRDVRVHEPVLLNEVLEQLAIRDDDVVIDGTIGHAGHSVKFFDLLSERGTLIGFDLDGEALKVSEKNLGAREGKACVVLIEKDMRVAAEELEKRGIEKIDVFFFDLGWGSHQLKCGRGFSFQNNEPLVLSYATNETNRLLDATNIVNFWDKKDIEEMIATYGEDRNAREIASAIVSARQRSPIATTQELTEVIESVVPSRGRLHSATKTFQALRMTVNDEIGALEKVLKDIPTLSNKGARVGFITFHSIEDRIVKRTFKQWQTDGLGNINTKKPITPSYAERKRNPRSRSAKFRLFTIT